MSSPAPRLHHRRRSLAGPIVLIALGVIFLLGNMHVVPWAALHHYFARYWPVLLIVWGVIRLLEHQRDSREGVPSRGIGAGGVLLILLLIMVGLGFTASDRVNWQALRHDTDMEGDFADLFGNSYNFTATLEQPFAGTDLRVISDRGDVVVSNWAEPRIKVTVRKKVVADNEQQARKIDGETQPTLSAAGNVTTLNANTGGAGDKGVASDLEIFIPEKANLDISTGRGEIRIAGRKGNVVTSSRGDVHIADNTGNVTINLRRGDVRLAKIAGEVSLDGRADDINIADVSGPVRLSGDFFGQMTLTRLPKGVSFHSSRTDMQLARLDGELVMDSGDLRANAVAGPVRLITRSKDIRLEDVSGDAKIVNQNGDIEYRAGTLGDLEIENQRGSMQVSLPARAAFQLEATAHRGDIESDFSGIQVQSDRQGQRASGTVGSGGPRVKLVNQFGDVQIRQRSSAAAPEAPPQAPSAPTLQRGALPGEQLVLGRGHTSRLSLFAVGHFCGRKAHVAPGMPL